MARTMIWITSSAFHGWGCSECQWNAPVPTLLSDPEAKSAYDRLSSGKFSAHLSGGKPVFSGHATLDSAR